MSDQPYHNEGFGKAFIWVVFILIPLPMLFLWIADGKDWSDRLIRMSFPERCAYEDAQHNKINNCEEIEDEDI